MAILLLPSAARTASGSAVVAYQQAGSTSAFRPEIWTSATFLLNVTAAATAVGDTLDVYLQSSADDGTTYDDFVHFTQVLGNGGAKKFVALWTSIATTPSTPLHAPTDATLAAGVSQGPQGNVWRVKWVIAGATPSFTFLVAVAPVILTGR